MPWWWNNCPRFRWECQPSTTRNSRATQGVEKRGPRSPGAESCWGLGKRGRERGCSKSHLPACAVAGKASWLGHELNFENTMLSCIDHRWDATRKEIWKSWGVDSDSLLFGRVPKTLFRQGVNDAGDRGKAFREARVKMKHWERIILNLRKKLE